MPAHSKFQHSQSNPLQMLTARQKSVLVQKQVGSVRRAEYRIVQNSFLLKCLEFKLNLVSNPVRFAWLHLLIIFQLKTAMVLVCSFCGRSLTRVWIDDLQKEFTNWATWILKISVIIVEIPTHCIPLTRDRPVTHSNFPFGSCFQVLPWRSA